MIYSKTDKGGSLATDKPIIEITNKILVSDPSRSPPSTTALYDLSKFSLNSNLFLIITD